MMVRIGTGGWRRLACAALSGCAAWTAATSAQAGVPHVVQPGETLWSIAYANNLTTRTVAAFNGLPEDALVVVGETVNVPTVEEGAAALANAGIAAGAPADAPSGGSRVVQPGESLWSIAIANGISVESLASANGLAADAWLIIGQSITVPGASAAAPATSATAGLGHIPSPHGELHLDPAAADSWNEMREHSLANYGVDLYPGGPLSAYRTYEQQAQLYEQFLAGQGSPANPPGTSTHELGIAVDVAEPVMRDVIDQIGGSFGWYGTIPSEWWHVQSGW